LCGFKKYPYLPQGWFFGLNPPSPPGISSLASYFLLKILPTETLLPVGISNVHPWSGMDISWNCTFEKEVFERNQKKSKI